MKKFIIFLAVILYAQKYTLNIFGLTYHFSYAKDDYPYEIGSAKYIANPGVGINYYFRQKYYFNFNYIINCWKNPLYQVGINRNFRKYYKGYFFQFDVGIDYIKSKFSTEYAKFLPLASVGVGRGAYSINVIYMPERFSANKNESFLFFFYQYDFSI